MKKQIDKIIDFVRTSSIANETLISFVSEFSNTNFTSILNNIQPRREPYFFSSTEKDGLSFLGFDSIFNINTKGKSRIEDAENRIIELEKNFVSNWNQFGSFSIPLFLGGMKFSVDSSTDLWSDYSDSEWFIPKFMFLNVNEKKYLVYNFWGNKSTEKEIFSDFHLLEMIIKPNVYSGSGVGEISLSSNGKEKNRWVENVNLALEKIDSGIVQKIVLSRQVDLELKDNFFISTAMEKLSEKYPRCYVFAFRKNDSIFFGASPEKLAKISNDWIEADALAGSISRGGSKEKDRELANALLSSKKDIAEQQIVVSFIRDSFSHFCSEVIFSETPVIRKLPNIQHLWTPIKGKIKFQQSLFSILKELHPTPAICGVPWDKARNSIIEMEVHDRGLFSGMIGWFNLNNEGEFAVAIRSALLRNKMIHAFAGCGIVKGSDPEFEYAESELKLKPIFSLFEILK